MTEVAAIRNAISQLAWWLVAAGVLTRKQAARIDEILHEPEQL